MGEIVSKTGRMKINGGRERRIERWNERETERRIKRDRGKWRGRQGQRE